MKPENLAMSALLLFTGHLKGVCINTGYMQHYVKMCQTVFSHCELVMITYRNKYGTVRSNRKYDITSIDTPLCIDRLKALFPRLKIEIVQEIMDNTTIDNTTFGIAYTKRYIQMISSIERGYARASSSKDIVIRMRPDSGIPGVNAIRSMNTWKTLLRIPENTIVQYGTWKKKSTHTYLNGDNCFAAKWNTFGSFVSYWKNEFAQDYAIRLKNKSIETDLELTMNTVAKRHKIDLWPNPNKIA